MVAIEAAAAGRPVICSRADGLMGHLESGAIDVGENTVDGWAARLSQLDSIDLPQISRRLRRHASGARQRFVDGWNRLIESTTTPLTVQAPAA